MRWRRVLALLAAGLLLVSTGLAQAEVKAELLGPAVIDREQNFAEVVLLRLSLAPGESDPIVDLVELGSQVYNGAHGASRLPRKLYLTERETVVALLSVAPHAADPRGVQLGLIHGSKRQNLAIPQWQDSDGNGQVDWFEARVRLILEAARRSPLPELKETVMAVSNWHQTLRVNCGGVLPKLPTVILLSPVCVGASGVNVHRLDLDRELTATVLHEAHHAQSYLRLSQRSGQDAVTAVYGAMLQCLFHGGGRCQGGIRPDEAFMRQQEQEAEAFAQKYKSRLVYGP